MYKYSILIFSLIFSISLLQSCNKEDSYADLRKKETKQIENFLHKGIPTSQKNFFTENIPFPIHVISEKTFEKNGFKTDLSKNEYVLFPTNGVYMQIVNKGTGTPIKNGQTLNVLCRYVEFNIANDTIQSSNRINNVSYFPDEMTITNNSGSISGTFLKGNMKSFYNSSAVPSGWLIPLKYINLGRQSNEHEKIALVRLILPSTQGQQDAQQKIYPCFYEISYQKGR